MKNSKNPLKHILLTFGIMLGIYLIIKLIFYCSIIGPQLFQMKESEYNVPKLCSDSEVIKLIEENRGKGMRILSDIGEELYNQNKYKEAYNVLQLASESEMDLPEDLPSLAFVYEKMGDCYRSLHNNQQACYYMDKAIGLMPEGAFEFDRYYLYFKVALAKYEKEVNEGFTESEKTVELLGEVLNLKTDDSERQQFYSDSKKQTISWIIKLYGYSPSLYNRNIAIKYYEKYLELDSENVDSYYGMTISYLELGDTKKAKESWGILKEKGINKIDNYVIGAYFHIVNGEMKEAEKYLKKLKQTAISHLNKTRYYYVSILYYQALGDEERAKEYLTKFVELSNSEV